MLLCSVNHADIVLAMFLPFMSGSSQYILPEETTQLRRKATWGKGPTTEPQTHDLCSKADFQPCEYGIDHAPSSHIATYVPWHVRA